jgi:hypothetical protein
MMSDGMCRKTSAAFRFSLSWVSANREECRIVPAGLARPKANYRIRQGAALFRQADEKTFLSVGPAERKRTFRGFSV